MNETFVENSINEYPFDANIAFDIGANFGKYTQMLSRKFKKVYAFEPDLTNIPVLRTATVEHGFNNVELVCKAISNKTGKTKFYYSDNNCGGHTIAEDIAYLEKYGHHKEQYREVSTITIDDFCYLKSIVPNLIKMDIEGAEDFAWEGAINTLRDNVVDIILEIHINVDTEKLSNFFRDLGYRFVKDDLSGWADKLERDRHYIITNRPAEQLESERPAAA